MLLKKEAAMKITAYKDEGRSSKIGSIELPYAADSLKLEMGNEYNKVNTVNTISGNIQYQGGKTAKVSVTFILDSTIYSDLISFAIGDNVSAEVKKLMKLIYSMNGSSHEPNYLILKWGDMPIGDSKAGGFYSRLCSIDISNKLVNSSGEPIKTIISCCFIESLSKKLIDKRSNKSSPDLTHVRNVHEKQTLTGMSHEIYEDMGYYIALAEFNGLDNFRRLKTGQSLVFPPLER